MSTLTQNIFYILGVATLLLAVLAVASKSILRATVYLMGVLTLQAGYYLLLGADFLAGVQILVYVGGIVVLLVFAVMLTRSEDLREDKPSLLRKIFGLLAAGGFFIVGSICLSSAVGLQRAVLTVTNSESESIRPIGRALLDSSGQGYLLPFEVVSFLLLAVLIAGIVIARKDDHEKENL